MGRKLAAVEKELARLEATAGSLRERLRDKATAESIETRCLLLDGRKSPEVGAACDNQPFSRHIAFFEWLSLVNDVSCTINVVTSLRLG